MNVRITFEIKDGKLIAPFQDEIEQVALELEENDIALENAELHRNIYFDVITLTDKYDMIWTDKYQGWLLRYLLES